MAEENVPAPTRTDEQLVPIKQCLPIGKSNLLIDLLKIQKNPIFHISFNQNADLLRNALGITPKDSTHPFMLPPACDLVIDFVNNLGYPKELQFVSKMYMNSLYQPWRTTLFMINQCLTGKTSDEEGEKKKKVIEAGKSKQPAPAKQPKLVKKKTSKPTPSRKIRKGRAPVGGLSIREPESVIARKIPKVEGKGKGIVSNKQAAQSLLDLQKPKKKNFTNDAKTGADTEKSNSEMNTEILYVKEEQGEEVSNMVALEERTVEVDEGQAGSNPSKTPESQPPPESKLMEEDQDGPNPRQSHLAQAGPNPEPMHEDFIATIYPKVHENLKLPTKEKTHIENPPSSSGTLSSMNNHDDAFTFGDQFLNDKSLEEELRKANVETKVESMVTVPIHQASSSVIHSHHRSHTSQTSITFRLRTNLYSNNCNNNNTSTTTTSTTTKHNRSDLVNRISALEKRSADFEQIYQLQDKTTKALASRVY
ncbi:hypothetical protein Tco_1323431 [Tanacetum coccineum]